MKQQPSPNFSSFSSRLHHLHNIISLVPDEQFNLDIYDNRCGTMGCALGWATQDSAFQALGFRAAGEGDWEPRYEGCDAFEAAGRFFGIRIIDARYLFSIYEYRCDSPFLECDGSGLHREEFLRRLNSYIEKAKTEERITHEATVSA